jgi:hypothetical protein
VLSIFVVVAAVLILMATAALVMVRALLPRLLAAPRRLVSARTGSKVLAAAMAGGARAEDRAAVPSAGPVEGSRTEREALRSGERRAVRWRWAGIAAGLCGAGVAIGTDSLGRGLLFAAPVFGLGVLAGALVGESLHPAPRGDVRVAQLRVRRTADYLPRMISVVVLVATVLLFALATATTMVAMPDDMGRPGRALTCTYAQVSETVTPWPGHFYTVPGLAMVIVGLLAAAGVLRRVVRRPQSAAVAAADDALRRRSAEVVVAAAAICVLVPLLGIAVTTYVAMDTLAGQCLGSGWVTAGETLIGVIIGAFAASAWCAACLFLPSRGYGRSRG